MSSSSSSTCLFLPQLLQRIVSVTFTFFSFLLALYFCYPLVLPPSTPTNLPYLFLPSFLFDLLGLFISVPIHSTPPFQPIASLLLYPSLATYTSYLPLSLSLPSLPPPPLQFQQLCLFLLQFLQSTAFVSFYPLFFFPLYLFFFPILPHPSVPFPLLP